MTLTPHRSRMLALVAALFPVALTAQATPLTSAIPATVPPAFQLGIAAPDSQVRTRAIRHSDLYYTRLKIHQIGSYAVLPLMAGEYFLGDKLLKGSSDNLVRTTHGGVAAGLGVLFGVNTATGLWNLWDSRNDPGKKALKYIHTGLLLASDAGFVWAGQTAHDAHRSSEGANRHRNIALGSMGLSAIGTVMMWLWN